MLRVKGCSKRASGFGVAVRGLLGALLAVWLAGTCGARAQSEDSARPERRATRSESPPHPANHLARETSPYLLMHAHNPVDWFPWSPEVFEKAAREGKPIFLSIGYSSCHWCHVMERLVFEDEQIARTMNEKFINVKVDREERPDVDDVYMTAFLVYSQAIGSNEGGGWPLSLFLTPAGKPFAGGTYFPPKDAGDQTGFPTILARVSDLWQNKRAAVEKNADALSAEVRRLTRAGLNLTPARLERGLAAAATTALIESRDSQFGGVEFDPHAPNGPKFPMPAKLALLQHEARHFQNEAARALLVLTLDGMAAGGIRDHLGGGFHRFSTDRRWHVPHFEKMLYDQALLAELYAQAFRLTGNRSYRTVAEETFAFVLNEMTEPDGGFISALDAETEGIEGTYYVWSIPEVDAVLGRRDAALFKRVYGFDEPKEFERGYVPYLPAPMASIARELKLPPDELAARLEEQRGTLLASRRQRPPLLRDDKVLTAWNGLMIGALARGGALLNRDAYVQAAEKGATFLLKRMRNDRGELLRSYRAGQAKIPAYLEDYAYLTDGLLALYETTRDAKWLRDARALCDEQIRLFWDDGANGFYFTSRNHEALIARTRNAIDAVLPSGNSVSVRNLVRLASYCHENRYRELARETLEAFAPALAKSPSLDVPFALALDEYLEDPEPGAGQSLADPDPAAAVADGGIIQTSGEESAPQSQNAPKPIVTAQMWPSVDKLPPGGTCEFVVFVTIKEGWHIQANPAQNDWQYPTQLAVTSKLGTKAQNVRYEKGKLARVPGSKDPVPVYEKMTTIRGSLSVPAEAAGQIEALKIEIRYQACDAHGCQAPAKVKLAGKMPVARQGESVKEANPNLFPKPRR